MRTVQVEGRIRNPLPLNPSSVVFRNHNPNILVIEEESKRAGAFGARRELDANVDNSHLWDKGKRL